MKRQDIDFYDFGRTWFFLIFCLFLLSGTGCTLHKGPSPLAPEALPPLLLAGNQGPSAFKGIGVLTLPENVPPGGSLQLAYTGERKQGLRIAALTPMGAPFFEIAATPKYAQVRDMGTGKLHKMNSFTSLSRQTIGFPIALEDLMDLLSDKLPLPSWKKAYADTNNPGIINLKTGNTLKAKLFTNERDSLYKMEYFSEGKSVYTITRVSEQPRVWQVEKPGQKLLLRIRSLAESASVSNALFSLE